PVGGVAHNESRIKETIQRTPDLVLMILGLEGRKIFEEIRARVSLEDLEDPNARELYISLEEMYRKEEWAVEQLLEGLRNNALKAYVLSRLMSEEFKIQQNKLIQDSIKILKRRNLIKQRDQVLKDILRCQKQGQEKELAALLEKKMYLDGELNKLRIAEDE
ncbi:MAG: hypothetical protein SNJ78_09510, partial [Spirochaetales bacterium]